MGFIRGGLLIILSFLLLILVFLGSVFLSLSWSLQYENVKTELGPVAKELTENKFNLVEEDFNLTEEMEEALESMKSYCENESEYVFSGGGYTFVIPCESLEEFNENPETLVDQGVEIIIEQIYYEDYECGFWNCFGMTDLPFFLVSEKARNYWKQNFYYSVIISIILIILIFFLLEQRQNTPIIVGSVLVLSSFPLAKLEKLAVYLVENSYFSFISIFFSKTGSVFWITLISGLIILGAGISWRFLNIDSWKKKFSKKDVKEIVKKEVSKKK